MQAYKTIRRTATLSRANRTGHLRVVLATQSPTLRFDVKRSTTYNEILLLSGAVWRTDRRQLPLVDSHIRDSIRGVLGSIRNCTVENSQLVGNLFWARDPRSQSVAQKIRDGHSLQFSVDAQPLEIIAIRDGEQFQGVVGPCDLIVRWVPLSVSVSI